MKPIGRCLTVMCLGAIVALAACDHKPDVRADNARPFVRLSVPVRGERLSYATTFRWTGWDKDGLIDHYEYAVDIPEEIPLDRINDPENTEVTWQSTANTEIRFQFATPTEDSVVTNGTVTVYPVDVGEHCVYVRAVDNEGAPSDVDFLCFKAENVHPRTQIDVNCARNGQVLLVGRRYVLRWTGEDPDGTDPERRPAYYEWKRIEVNPLGIPPEYDLSYYVARDPGPWNRAEADSAIIDFQTPRGYILAIRAVDENGGTESRFIRARNAIVLQASSSNPGTPVLTVSCPALGTYTFPRGPARYEVPAGIELTFDLVADADAYCAVATGFNWGVDVSDAESDFEFRGWTLSPRAGPFAFPAPGIRTITFKARDDIGGVTIGTIVFTVIPVPLDRDILYVDDYRQNRQGSISDVLMDTRVQTMLSDASPEFFKFDVWGDQDLASAPTVPTLSELVRYKFVLWSVFGSGIGATNGLVTAATCGPSRLIQLYVSQGGGLWIYGDQVWGSFRKFGTSTCKAVLGYDESRGLNFNPGEFPCDFMKICGGDFREAKTSRGTRGVVDGLLRALPTAEAGAELFPPMEVDSTVFFQPAIPFVDAMFQPVFAPGGLDTLYTMRAPGTSNFNDKPVAFRYFDPDPASQQGPIAVFGFSFHLLKQGSWNDRTGVRGMARSMVDWFRSHQRGGS